MVRKTYDSPYSFSKRCPDNKCLDLPTKVVKCTPEDVFMRTRGSCRYFYGCAQSGPVASGSPIAAADTTDPAACIGAVSTANTTDAAASISALGGIQTQLVGGAQQILTPGQTLIFDTIIHEQSPNIRYDPLSGTFTFRAVGNYFVSWWTATNESDLFTDLQFALRVNAAEYAQESIPIITQQVNGSALVTVGFAPISLVLSNATFRAVALASTPVQADLIILQVS